MGVPHVRGICCAIVLMAGAACRADAQSLSDVVFPQAGSQEIGIWNTEVTPGGLDDHAVNPWSSTVVALAPKSLKTRSVLTTLPSGLLNAHDEKRSQREKNPLAGMASYYGAGVGERTATGEAFDPAGLTAAHRTLPFGTRVKVVRVDTGDSVVVRINDRGPFKPGRVIDLSQGAAENLGITTAGLANVRLEVLGQ